MSLLAGSLVSEKRINLSVLYSKLLLFRMEKLFCLLVPLSFLLVHVRFRSPGIDSNPMPSTSLFSWLTPCLEDIYLNVEIQQYRDCTFSARKCAVSFFFKEHTVCNLRIPSWWQPFSFLHRFPEHEKNHKAIYGYTASYRPLPVILEGCVGRIKPSCIKARFILAFIAPPLACENVKHFSFA